jgi:hypothetical protein
MIYEYKAISEYKGSRYTSIDSILNSLAEKGWRVIASKRKKNKDNK